MAVTVLSLPLIYVIRRGTLPVGMTVVGARS
jgi:hypothetical protein